MPKNSKSSKKRSVLITGANGFIGGFLTQWASTRGWEVLAGVRKDSDLTRILALRDVKIVDLHYENTTKLRERIEELRPDYVVHLAALTNSLKEEDFMRVNFGYTKSLVDIIKELGCTKRFVFMSSLAVNGPGDPKTLAAIQKDARLAPAGSYGKSKKLAEAYVCSELRGRVRYTILRPTAVYGPGDRDCTKCFSMVEKGFELHLGGGASALSFIYVEDLAKVVMACLTEAKANDKVYIVSDNKRYSQSEFFAYIKKCLKKKTVKITVPRFIASFLASALSWIGRLVKKTFFLNKEKYSILKARNWYAVDVDLRADLDFTGFHSLEEGIVKTADWFKKAGK